MVVTMAHLYGSLAGSILRIILEPLWTIFYGPCRHYEYLVQPSTDVVHVANGLDVNEFVDYTKIVGDGKLDEETIHLWSFSYDCLKITVSISYRLRYHRYDIISFTESFSDDYSDRIVNSLKFIFSGPFCIVDKHNVNINGQILRISDGVDLHHSNE